MNEERWNKHPRMVDARNATSNAMRGLAGVVVLGLGFAIFTGQKNNINAFTGERASDAGYYFGILLLAFGAVLLFMAIVTASITSAHKSISEDEGKDSA